MARVRLTLKHSNRLHVFRFLRPGGAREAIPALRLEVIVDLRHLVVSGPAAGQAAFPDCILDTGSPLTVIPDSIHRHFQPRVVTPLPFDRAMPRHLREVGLAGGTFPYELGELTIRLRDLSGGILDVAVVAQLVRDTGVLTIPMILGLRGGVLDGRVLRAAPDPAAPFGQVWALEDP